MKDPEEMKQDSTGSKRTQSDENGPPKKKSRTVIVSQPATVATKLPSVPPPNIASSSAALVSPAPPEITTTEPSPTTITTVTSTLSPSSLIVTAPAPTIATPTPPTPPQQAIDKAQYKEGVLGYIYHDYNLIVGLSAKAAGLKALRETMEAVKKDHQAVFQNMFASSVLEDRDNIPIPDTVREEDCLNYSLQEIENMASAWLGAPVKAGSGERSQKVVTNEGEILLKYRPPTVKQSKRGATGDQKQANLEIQVKPRGSEKYTTIVNLHVNNA